MWIPDFSGMTILPTVRLPTPLFRNFALELTAATIERTVHLRRILVLGMQRWFSLTKSRIRQKPHAEIGPQPIHPVQCFRLRALRWPS